MSASPHLAFFDRLRAAARERETLLCLNLDPQPDLIPGPAAAAAQHCIEIVRRTAEFTCCYKPNSAFWEQYGPDGWRALMEVRAAIPAGIPVLLDAKRGDIGHTMRAYATAVFETLGMDAVTVNGYLGLDSLAEFTRHADRGVYVLCRTSNPGAADLQHLDAGGKPLFLRVAELAARANGNGNVGLVVGATAPSEVAEVRAAAPGLPFLVPGVGAQGGDLEASIAAAWNGDEASCLIAVGRSVIYAEDPAREARALRDVIRGLVARAR
ncbi:MAG: orotidine-5'-phosphate decarboxylase [Candidatus Dormibacteraceae bacterium]